MTDTHTTLQLVGKIACLKYVGHLFGAHGTPAKRKIADDKLLKMVGVSSGIIHRWVREQFLPKDGQYYDNIVHALSTVQRRDTKGRDLGVTVGLKRDHFEESFSKLEFAACLGLKWFEAHEIYDLVLAKSIRARHFYYMDGSESEAFFGEYEGIYDVFYWNPYDGRSKEVICSRMRIRNCVRAENNASVITAKLHMLAFEQQKSGTFHPYDGRVVWRGQFLYFYFEENSIEASERNLRDMVTMIIAPRDPKNNVLAGTLSTTTREGYIYSSPVALKRVERHISTDFERAEVKILMRDKLKVHNTLDGIDHSIQSILKQGDIVRVLGKN